MWTPSSGTLLSFLLHSGASLKETNQETGNICFLYLLVSLQPLRFYLFSSSTRAQKLAIDSNLAVSKHSLSLRFQFPSYICIDNDMSVARVFILYGSMKSIRNATWL